MVFLAKTWWNEIKVVNISNDEFISVNNMLNNSKKSKKESEMLTDMLKNNMKWIFIVLSV